MLPIKDLTKKVDIIYFILNREKDKKDVIHLFNQVDSYESPE